MVDLTTPLSLEPPFDKRHFSDPDGRRWGARATNPIARGPRGPAPRKRWMIFLCEDCEQRKIEYGLMEPDHVEISEGALLELWREAEVTER